MSTWGRSDPVWVDKILDWRRLYRKKGAGPSERGWLGQKIAQLSIAPARESLL